MEEVSVAARKMEFKPATRRQLKVKIGLMGTAGTGKTWQALVIAEALAGPKGKIAVIDSERGRAEAYAGDFTFDHLKLPNYAPETYIEALALANDEGYDVIVPDSISHEWMGRDGILSSVDRFGGWKEATPRHDEFVETLFRLPRHVICTIRAKTQYQVQEVPRDGGGTKQEITKLGVGPVQRDSIEYEFDLLGMLELDHTMRLHKSVISSLPSGMILQPGENPRQLGREIAFAVSEWVNEGEAVAVPEEADEKEIAYLRALLQAEGFDDTLIDAQFKKRRLELGALTAEYVQAQAGLAVERLTAKAPELLAPIQAAHGHESDAAAPNGDAPSDTPPAPEASAEGESGDSATSGSADGDESLGTTDEPAPTTSPTARKGRSS